MFKRDRSQELIAFPSLKALLVEKNISIEDGGIVRHIYTQQPSVTQAQMALRSALQRSAALLRRERRGSNKSAAEANEMQVSHAEGRQSALTDQVPDSGPVGVAEGASYSLAILAGLGLAGSSVAFLLSDLAVEPREQQVYRAALERVRSDPRATARLGEPIQCAEESSTPRRSRPRLRHRAYESADTGSKRMLVEFSVVGSRNVGLVRADGDGNRVFLSGIFGTKEPELSSVELDVLSGANKGRISVDPRPLHDRGSSMEPPPSVTNAAVGSVTQRNFALDK